MAESMYVIAKREKVTIFLECQLSDTISALKRLVALALKKDPVTFELFKVETKGAIHTVTGVMLDENRTVEGSQLENESVVAVVYKDEGGSFEDISDLIVPLSTPTPTIPDGGRGEQ